MSHYTFQGYAPYHRIVVGWDDPLSTYFAQVWDERKNEEDLGLVLWSGCEISVIRTVEELQELIASYGKIPEQIEIILYLDSIVGPSSLVLSLIRR